MKIELTESELITLKFQEYSRLIQSFLPFKHKPSRTDFEAGWRVAKQVFEVKDENTGPNIPQPQSMRGNT